jgi:hypothetical protein
MKIPESKRSEIGIIAEFRGIPNGFPNLVVLLLMKQGGVTVPPRESPACAAKTKANNWMHELQHPLGVHTTLAADWVSGEGMTTPAAEANFAHASSFPTTTTTAVLEIESSFSSDDESMERNEWGGSTALGRKKYWFVFFAPQFPFF